MKKTRNLLVLVTSKAEEKPAQQALQEISFTGLVTLDAKHTSKEAINQAFLCNKSVICANPAPELQNEFDSLSIPAFLIPSGIKTPLTIDLGGNISRQLEIIVDMFNLDIGTPLADASSLSGGTSVESCAYCKYLANPLEEPAKILYKSPNFSVFTTPGQFIPAYLLIIPREHVASLSQLSKAKRDEFLEVLDDVQTIMHMAFHTSHFLIWESGAAANGQEEAEKSVVHANVHIASSKMTAESIVKLFEFGFQKISFLELSSYGKNPYLLIRDKDEFYWWINDNPELYIPCQYVRQLLAEENQISNKWDWHKFPFMEERKTTTDLIHSTLVSHWNSIPRRIQDRTQILMSAY